MILSAFPQLQATYFMIVAASCCICTRVHTYFVVLPFSVHRRCFFMCCTLSFLIHAQMCAHSVANALFFCVVFAFFISRMFVCCSSTLLPCLTLRILLHLMLCSRFPSDARSCWRLGRPLATRPQGHHEYFFSDETICFESFQPACDIAATAQSYTG